MKKTSIRTQDNTKPFKVALGIALTFLALVVLYVAFAKGGLDIRSRASVGSDLYFTGPSPTCPSGYSITATSYISTYPVKKRITCRKLGSVVITPTPTRKLSPVPTKPPCGHLGEACCFQGTCYQGLRCFNSKCVTNAMPTPTKAPVPTATTWRCCPRINTTYAINTCYGASQTGCKNNPNYCVWTNSAYCSY